MENSLCDVFESERRVLTRDSVGVFDFEYALCLFWQRHTTYTRYGCLSNTIEYTKTLCAPEKQYNGTALTISIR